MPTYDRALTALSTSATIGHFLAAWILDLMCFNWFSPAWHCPSAFVPAAPPTPSYPPCIYISIYPCISLTLRLSNITRLDRLRWMDGSRKSSQWCYPPCDLAHDTMSPKCQTWRRIKCFKVSQAQIKPNRPLGWWTSFFSRKKASSCGRHDTWALEHRHNICHVAY